jgi:uncharacterized protein (TIGR02001 family)
MIAGALGPTGLAIALLSFHSPADAQVRGGVSLDSDDRRRGVSISGGRPALGVNAAYDAANGLYLGGSAAFRDTTQGGAKLFNDVEYIGYAARLTTGQSWDVGLRSQQITFYTDQERSVRYTELYAGLSNANLSAHVYYSPDYFAKSASAAYLEVDGALHPAENWRLFGHAGVLTPLGGQRGRRERYDPKAGVARDFRAFELHLAWTAAFPRPQPDTSQNRAAVVAGASVSF